MLFNCWYLPFCPLRLFPGNNVETYCSPALCTLSVHAFPGLYIGGLS
jgi:hypothetical protein